MNRNRTIEKILFTSADITKELSEKEIISQRRDYIKDLCLKYKRKLPRELLHEEMRIVRPVVKKTKKEINSKKKEDNAKGRFIIIIIPI